MQGFCVAGKARLGIQGAELPGKNAAENEPDMVVYSRELRGTTDLGVRNDLMTQARDSPHERAKHPTSDVLSPFVFFFLRRIKSTRYALSRSSDKGGAGPWAEKGP